MAQVGYKLVNEKRLMHCSQWHYSSWTIYEDAPTAVLRGDSAFAITVKGLRGATGVVACLNGW